MSASPRDLLEIQLSGLTSDLLNEKVTGTKRWGWGSAICVLTSLRGILMRLHTENHCIAELERMEEQMELLSLSTQSITRNSTRHWAGDVAQW